MKAYRKLIAINTLLCCCILLFGACAVQGNSDSPIENRMPTTTSVANDSDLIIGAWVPISVKVVLLGESYHYDTADHEAAGITTFQSNGSISSLNPLTNEDYEGGHWQLNDEKLIVSEGDLTLTYTIVKLNRDSLVLRLDFEEMVDMGFPESSPGDYIETTYKKQG